jgi:hypothetical protein
MMGQYLSYLFEATVYDFFFFFLLGATARSGLGLLL